MRFGLGPMLGASLAVHGAIAVFFLAPSTRGAPTASDLVDPPPQIAGETFELPAPESAVVPLANASPSPDTNASEAPAEVGDAPARPKPPSRAKPGSRPSHQGRPSAGRAAPTANDEAAAGGSGAAVVYGAVGDRSAADLTRAFTRGFPQAASGDPIWRSIPLGSAGDATLVLTLDDTGHINEVQIIGNASGALAQGIWRTMALIKGRPFTAKGRVTKLHLTATVRSDDTHEHGLNGEVFAIGTPTPESAFFALNVGRRIDLHVTPR